ncbi:SDR family oxidoreductase [Microvirga arsenatis]|uniref:SDR family NAD(P)-dependent oxidoreductase n=1 Tax=Microvirga arsenatis TaxID=2692265 RepID=A0ABW9YVU4_9HYPH|nr:SDR family oxidoreductase [Microvirga arsenatis]NBJ10579.1 SDR family NAD(P)-dependent oxidoreductase [Microvirga arsenatis]NBJ24522.1 SDR family NAD(P)-dependent oxidoreductase [Microvirga arsenatis]
MAFRQKPVEEQVVVITGASSGIGLATAHLFAERGARGLVLVARNEEALRRIAGELSQGNTRAVAVAADVSRREDLERVARTAIDTFGGFDTWVNDAAVAVYGSLTEVPLEDQRHLFEVNYWGVVNGSLIAAEHMRRRGGTIINVGSVLSERTMILQAQYSASKHAVKAFTDGLRMELENQGAPIAITLIKPSSIDTPYVEHARNYLDRENAVPPPAYDPHLVAKAIVFSAEHQRREITVGFGGWVIGAMGKVAPRLVDKAMEWTGYGSQTTDQPERPAMRDNLYEAREDEDIYSSLPGEPRKTSLLLEAQLHPFVTAAVLAGVAAGIAALFMRPAASSRRSRPVKRPTPRYQPTMRRTGNGHDKRTLGPGHVSQRGPYEGRPQPRH